MGNCRLRKVIDFLNAVKKQRLDTLQIHSIHFILKYVCNILFLMCSNSESISHASAFVTVIPHIEVHV